MNMKSQVHVESEDVNAVSKALNFMNKQGDMSMSDFNLIHFFVNPGAQSVLDQHKVKEYWFVMKGSGELKINGENCDVKAGELYFFDSMISHHITNKSQTESLEILSIWW